jgi:cysteine desulfurase family protein
MNMRIHMNHAATSAVKPREVVDALTAYLLENSHQSAGRGGDELSAMRTVFESRGALAELFGAGDPSHVVFTSGATESLNMAIHGLAADGCHILATGLEHNAVARPLHLLQKQGRVSVTWLACGPDGGFDPGAVAKAVRPNTRFLVMTHASNVLGNVLPVKEAFAAAKACGLLTVLDAAQTAGHMEVCLDADTDVVAFTGHKGLRGVAGIGGLILSETAAAHMEVWKTGGAGSQSQSLDMPDSMPDKLEAGTPNMLGIISLRAAAEAIRGAGIDNIRRREREVTDRFVAGLKDLPVDLYGHGPSGAENRMPVVSMNLPGMDAGVLARRLSEEFGIETRSGLHCAPLAHKTIGTFPRGTLRFSFSADTTPEEVDYALAALASIL